MTIDNRQFDKALKSFRKTSLSSAAKKEMKQSIIDRKILLSGHRASPYQSLLYKGKKAVAGASIVFAGFGGVAFASTNSLPNDVLYPVKVEIVEPLIGLTKVSAEAKQEYQIDLALKRIDELTELDLNGELDTQTEQEIKQDFQKHIEQAELYDSGTQSNFGIEQTIELFIMATSLESDMLGTGSVKKEVLDSNDPTIELEINTQQQVSVEITPIELIEEVVQETVPETKVEVGTGVVRNDDESNDTGEEREVEIEVLEGLESTDTSVETTNEIEKEINTNLGL